jgi:hypothetical protein
MGFWKRLFSSSKAPAPEWSAMRSAEEYETFVALVEADLRGRGEEVRIEDGVAHTSGELLDGGHFGLQNVAQRCARALPEAWPELVKAHFDAVIATMGPGAGKPDMSDLERVRTQLRARLYPALPVLDRTFGWPLTEELFLALAVDLPTSVVTVSRAERAAWSIDDEALGRLAMDNLAREAPARESTAEAGDGVVIRIVEGESMFTATRAVALFDGDAHREHPFGALVVVPTRHVFAWVQIESMKELDAVAVLAAVAEGAHREGPGSITEQVYWVHQGKWHLVQTARNEDGSFSVQPPDGLVVVMNRLATPRS